MEGFIANCQFLSHWVSLHVSNSVLCSTLLQDQGSRRHHPSFFERHAKLGSTKRLLGEVCRKGADLETNLLSDHARDLKERRVDREALHDSTRRRLKP
jgi:hypothetical protein